MKKGTFILSGLLLIAACAFAQAPEWQWATQAGGIHYDEGMSITVDNAGNSYLTGCFDDTATFGSYSLTSNDMDIFVAKMDASGNWQWATQAGGTHFDYGDGIVVDDNGNSYVIGCFNDTATFGSYSLTSNGIDIFVAKMDAIGNWLWATQAGGSWDDFGEEITIDDAGNSYVTGSFSGTATFGSYSITSNGWSDIFVAKMDANGNWLWATKAGGSSSAHGMAIIIDDVGNSYVTGSFSGTATFGSYSLTSSGYYGFPDIFVAKMDEIGNWQWATKAGGSGLDEGKAIAIDNAGSNYVTGWFDSTATFGPYSITSSGIKDIFVAKMDADGNWQWVTQAGGISYDWGLGITVDHAGNSYVTGFFCETATFGSYSLNCNGDSDIFIAKMDSNGDWQWVTQAGGTGSDQGYGITIDDVGNSYVTGFFEDTATFGSYSLTSSGYNDIFVAKLNSSVFAENEILPTINCLSNFPNPFNPSTIISFSLNTENTSLHNATDWQAEDTELIIYNLKGQKIRTFSIPQSEIINPNSIVWDGNDNLGKRVSSGIYLYRIKTDNYLSEAKKMLLLK